MMRASRSPIILLIGLFVFTPFAFASTYEAWSAGIYDAETDEILRAAKCPDAAIECAPLVVARYVPAVATVALVRDDSAAPAVVLPARPCRAPPAS
jgi:hypothetical protein